MKKKRLFRKHVTKTRVLRPDLGKVNDTLYHDLTGTSIGDNAMPTSSREYYILGLYSYYKSLRNLTSLPDAGAWPYGCETMNSRQVVEKYRWSNCVHLSQRAIQHPYGRIALGYRYLTTGPSSYDVFERYYRRPMPTAYWRDAANTALQCSLSDEQLFSARAYWSMRPKFQSDVSLINSIFEIKDFSDIAKYLFSPAGLTRTALKAVPALKKFASHALSTDKHAWSTYRVAQEHAAIRLAKQTGESTYNWLSKPGLAMGDIVNRSTGLAANATLTYNLAIMPTIRDAMSIHAAAQKDVFELAKTFKEYGEEGARSHYSEETVLQNTLTFGTRDNALWGSGKYVIQKRSAMMVSYYQHLWERLEDRYPKWWGLEIGADEIWNMLPMSFVLDYFFTVGKSLEYMDIDKSVAIHHVDYLESVKTLASLGTHYLHNARTSHLVINDEYIRPRSKGKCLLVSGTMGKYYKRQVKEPYKGPALPKLKAPSVSQAGNLLALVRCLLF